MTLSLRDLTGEDLATFLTDAGLDDPWSDEPLATTRMRYAPDGVLFEASRLRVHADLIESRRALTSPPENDGTLAVVVTAGPPGAGKTTALARMPELAGFRHVDADDFKDPLLERSIREGLLGSWTERLLRDGRPVAPRELSAFVHAESTSVADAYRREALRAGENVVVHGTLSSMDYVEDLLDELDDAGYDRLIIVDVDAPLDTALEQAASRWWRVRDAQTDRLGGRFIPPSAIRGYYPTDTDSSVCSSNVRELEAQANALGWDVTVRHP